MVSIPSFAKINLGLKIGPARSDGFHELRTVYQTLALHDIIRVEVRAGSGIEIRCDDPRVPLDESNTCYKIAESVLRETKASGQVVIEIEKHLPVQGGMGAASSNAVAAMLGLERALGLRITPADRLRIAAEVGSDLPLFLIGGTVLGVGRGEEVYPLPDLPPLDVVIITPAIGVSTPKAFAQWDALASSETGLTGAGGAGTINKFSGSVFAWLSNGFPQAGRQSSFALDGTTVEPASGVPVLDGNRAETLLLDLVRAGIDNDFEHVVFPEYPELSEVKRVLEREGARYASLSGSGSTLYGLFVEAEAAQAAAENMRAAGYAALATTTLTREEYWKTLRG